MMAGMTAPSSEARVPPPPPNHSTDDRVVDGRAVLRGALAALAVIVPVTILRAVLDHEMARFDDSGWVYPLFLLILVGYAVGGAVAARVAPDAPLSNGALAGLGALVLWIPIRVVIWAVREDNRGLFSGHKAALAPGQLFGGLVIAAGLGMLGASLGPKLRRRRRS
jgi:hypothetical protein